MLSLDLSPHDLFVQDYERAQIEAGPQLVKMKASKDDFVLSRN